jgi:mgtE-like transporter
MTVYSSRKIIKESMPLLSILIALEVVGGQFLFSNEAALIRLPIFLVMIPVINGVGGNIGSILGARLSSALHLGSIGLRNHQGELRSNILSSLLLGIISYTTLTIFVLGVSPVLGVSLGTDFLLKAGFIMIATGLLLTAIVIIVSVLVARFSFENGLDPDNTVTPVVTTICDLLGIILLMAMIGAVGI